MRRSIAVAIAAVLAVGTLTAVLAQEASGVSADDVTKRAEAYARQAADLVETSEARRKAAEPEARSLVEHALRSIGSADVSGLKDIEAKDLGALVAASGGGQGKLGSSHVGLIAFVSLSMPPDSLRKVMLDMQKAGGVVVFRGFPNNSMAGFKTQLGAVMPTGAKFRNIGIDPRLFEAFHVDAVPTYVAVERPLDLCKPLECESTLPDYDVIRGNVPLGNALETIANGKGPGSALARTGLAQLEAQ